MNNPTYAPQRALPHPFVNFLCSLVPGAGHMYQGLMRRGTVLMAAFAAGIICAACFGSLYGIGRLLAGTAIAGVAITYFYSYFDSMRTCRLIRSGAQMPGYVDELDVPLNLPSASGRGKLILGGALTVIGAISLFSVIVNRYIPRDLFNAYLRPALELLLPLAFVGLGIALLLVSRKKQN